MKYVEYRPHPALQPYIECYWSAQAEKPPFQNQEALIPDGTIELMFNFSDAYQEIQAGESIDVKGSHIIGIRKKSLFIQQADRQDFFTVRFKLGGSYPFFKIPAYLFSNRFTGLRDLLGADYNFLEEALYECSDNQHRKQLLDQFFLKRLQANSTQQQTFHQFIRIVKEQRSKKVMQICSENYIHYKTLERHVKQVCGLNPREYLKIRRFNLAIKQMYACQLDTLTDVAYAVGYYEHAHFIRDFKA